MAIGKAGAINAALMAIQILGNQDRNLREKLANFRANRAKQVEESTLPPNG